MDVKSLCLSLNRGEVSMKHISKHELRSLIGALEIASKTPRRGKRNGRGRLVG